MCGLVGIAGFNNFGIGFQERNIFKQLLIADTVRGEHGTGALIIDEDGVNRSLKVGGTPHDLFRSKDWAEFFEPPYKAGRKKDLVLVGHNRLASVGKISTPNAHPHHADHIALVHNGTIREYSNLPKIKELDVDSAALAHAIAELGIEEAISRTHGAYAIVYHDEKENTLNFLRNDERPLWFAQDKLQTRLLWASEPAMLEWICGRNNIRESDRRLYAVKSDTLITFHLSDYNKADFAPIIKTVKGPTVIQHYRQGTLADEIDAEAEVIASAMGHHGVSQVRYTPPKRTNLPALLASPPTSGPLHEKSSPTLFGPDGNIISLPSKRARKTLMGALNGFRQMGRPIEVLDKISSISGEKYKKGENISFTVSDYVDDKEPGAFVVSAISTRFPDTIIKFRAANEEELEDCFNFTLRTGEITNIAHYPESTKEDGYRFVIWTTDVRAVARAVEPSQIRTERDNIIEQSEIVAKRNIH